MEDLTVDVDGNALVVGQTNGFDSLKDSGAFVAKLTSKGAVLWVKLAGDQARGEARAIAVDAQKNIFVAGLTEGSLPDQPNVGKKDVFVTKLDPDGNVLWTRQFGSIEDEGVSDIAIGSDGSIFVSGSAEGVLPSNDALGDSGAFVAKLDPTGEVVWSRQFGSYASGLAVSEAGVFVSGWTSSSLPGTTAFGRGDAFVSKLDALGNVVWSRLIGTDESDSASGIALGADGHVFITGTTTGAFPGHTNGQRRDAVLVAELDPNGAPLWTHQFGWSEGDKGNAIAVDEKGRIFVTGDTSGRLPGAPIPRKDADAFVIEVDSSGKMSWWGQGLPENTYKIPHAIALGSGGAIFIAGTSAGETLEGLWDGFVARWTVP